MGKKPVTGKPELLKRINRNTIIKLIMKHQTISRSQLADLTKLALPSVMRIVEGLIAEGLVMDVGKGQSTGGRKPNLVTLNKDYRYVLGVEIAVNTVVILSDLVGNILERQVHEQEPGMTPEMILEKVVNSIQFMKQQRKLQDHQIAGIGVGTPGTNFKHIHDVERSILKGWESTNVKAWLEGRTPHLVEVENVARTRTLSELWFGRGRTNKSFIYVFVDRGVGCGIVNNEVIFKGANGVAGEFGHTTIELQGRQCYCGKKGCIEMYVSTGAITNAVQNLEEHKRMEFGDVIARQNTQAIKDMLIESGRVLGVGIGNLINTYNPEAVVLGGEVPLSSPIFANACLEMVNSQVFNNDALNTPIYISEIDHDHTCIGSVALVIDKVFKSVEL